MATTFADLVATTAWTEIKAALVWLYPDTDHDLASYQQVFRSLRTMQPEVNPMRIAIEARALPGVDEDPTPEVIGHDGTRNGDLPDCPTAERDSEYGKRETAYSLSLQPWRNWLGMAIEGETLRSHDPAQIIALVLFDMTFHGFTEAEHRAVLCDLKRRVEEIDAMTDAERREKLIPGDQVFTELRRKLAMDEPKNCD